MDFNPYIGRKEYRIDAIDQEMSRSRQNQKRFDKKKKNDSKEIEIFKKQLWDLSKVIPKAPKKLKRCTPIEDLRKEIVILDRQIRVLKELSSKNPIREEGEKRKFLLNLLKGVLFKNKKLTYHKVKKKTQACQKELGLNLKMMKENLRNLKLSSAHSDDFVEKKRQLLQHVEKLMAMNHKLF